MRELITIIAAGSLMSAYALISPTIVEALQDQSEAPRKTFVQRLSQAGGETPVTTVRDTLAGTAMIVPGRAVPLFALSGDVP